MTNLQPQSYAPLPTWEQMTPEFDPSSIVQQPVYDPSNPGQIQIRNRTYKSGDPSPSQIEQKPSAHFILAPSSQSEISIGGTTMSNLPSLPGQMGIPKFRSNAPQPWQVKQQQEIVNERYDPEIGGFEVLDRVTVTTDRPQYKGGIVSRTRPDGQIELFRTPKVKEGQIPSADLRLHPNQQSLSRSWDKDSARREIQKAQSAGYLYQDDAPRVAGNPNSDIIRILPSGEIEGGTFNPVTQQVESTWQYPSPFSGDWEVPQSDPSVSHSGNVEMNLLESTLQQMRQEKAANLTPEQQVIQSLGGKSQLQMEWEKGLKRGNNLFEQDRQNNRVLKNPWANYQDRGKEIVVNVPAFLETQESDRPLNPIVAHEMTVNKNLRKEDVAGIKPRYIPPSWDKWNLVTDPVIGSPMTAGVIHNQVPTKDGQGIRIVKERVDGLEYGKPAIGGWKSPSGEFRTPINPRTGQPYNTGENIIYKMPMSEEARVSAIQSVSLPKGAKYHSDLNAIQLPDSNVPISQIEDRLSVRGGFPRLISILDSHGEDTGKSAIITGSSHLSQQTQDGTNRKLEQLTPEGVDHLQEMAKQYALSQKNPLVSNPEILKILPEHGVPVTPVEGLQTMRQFLGGTKKGEPGLYELQMDAWGIKDLSDAQMEAISQNHDKSHAAQSALDKELSLGNPKISLGWKLPGKDTDRYNRPNSTGQPLVRTQQTIFAPSVDSIYSQTGEKVYPLQEFVSHYPEFNTNKGGRETLVSEQSGIVDANREIDKSDYNPVESIQQTIRSRGDANAIQQVARNLLDTEIANRSSAAPVENQPVVSSGDFRSISQGLPGVSLPQSAIQRKSIPLDPEIGNRQRAILDSQSRQYQSIYDKELSDARQSVRSVAAKLPDNVPVNASEAAHERAMDQPDMPEEMSDAIKQLNEVIRGARQTDRNIVAQHNPNSPLPGKTVHQIQAAGQMEDTIRKAKTLGWKADPSKIAGAETMTKDAKDYLDNFMTLRSNKQKAAQADRARYNPGGSLYGWDKVDGLPAAEMADQSASKKIVNTLKVKGATDQKPQWFQSWDKNKAEFGHQQALNKLRDTLRQSFPIGR